MRKYGGKIVLFLLIIIFLFIGYLTVFQPRQIQEYSREEFLMDTLVSISTYGTDTNLLQEATAKAFHEMRRLADLTDRFAVTAGNAENDSDSDLLWINNLAGCEPVVVDQDVFRMLQMAQECSVLTNGAFDITIGPVMDLWGFGQPQQQVPADDELRAALSLVNFQDLILNEQEHSVFLKRKGMSLDLDAVAKGYAVEKAARILEKSGVKRAMIDAGGNIRVIGQKDYRQLWKVGIRDPRNPQTLIGILSLENESAVTSGDYQRYIQIAGKTYHHIISPQTGYPARGLMSVTVVTEDSGKADLLSTALFLLKPEQALLLAKQFADTEVVLVTDEKQILFTPGLQGKIQLTPGEEYSYEKKTAD